MLKDPHQGGNVLDLLADLLADLRTHVAAVKGTQLLYSQLVLDPLKEQVLRQPLPFMTAPAVRGAVYYTWRGIPGLP
jgi:hypothetical protein